MITTFDEAQMRAVFSALPDPLFVITESGRYAAVIGGSDTRFYHDGSGLVGKYLRDVLPPDKTAWIMEQIGRVLREGSLYTVEYGLSGKEVEGLDAEVGPSGEIWFEGRMQPLPFLLDGERAVVWVARNITRSHDLEAELRRLGETDELTGALNRRKLIEALDARFAEFRRYGLQTALLILDVDHFKRINDRFGHIAGDQVLRATAQNCMAQLRSVDLFYRFGGEEFVVLLPNTDARQAHATAERLRQSVENNRTLLGSRETGVTISIGISNFAAHDTGAEGVIRRADDALYKAKREGRNRVVA